MDLAEAMRTQRAIRRLKPDPVDDDLLLRCLELATRAPSGGNRQPAEFILVRDRRAKAALGRLYRQSWSVYGGLGKLLYGSHDRTRKILAAVDWQVEHWEEVPVVVVACLRGVALPLPGVARSSRGGGRGGRGGGRGLIGAGSGLAPGRGGRRGGSTRPPHPPARGAIGARG